MRILISEVRAALKLRLYMPGVIGLFAIPDAAATVEYGTIKPSERYPRWFDAHVDSRAKIDGKLAWMVRNALIHEAAMNWRTAGYQFDRLVIGVPEATKVQLHGVGMNRIGDETASLVVELEPLADAILSGALRWLAEAEQDEAKAKALQGLMQVRPGGYDTFIIGKPVIT